MRILNLYCGIGGNRKLWGDEHGVTAVEYNEEIAAIYKEYFPNDTVIIGDAHQYLLDHYQEFDFIWTSTPCPSWSRANFWASKTATNRDKYYPDMKLYQEIIFLKHWFKGDWVAENVIPYCDPLIPPTVELDRHLFWSNFPIAKRVFERTETQIWSVTSNTQNYGFDVSKRKIKHRKDQIIRNLVNPELGLYILNQAMKVKSAEPNQQTLFQ